MISFQNDYRTLYYLWDFSLLLASFEMAETAFPDLNKLETIDFYD